MGDDLSLSLKRHRARGLNKLGPHGCGESTLTISLGISDLNFFKCNFNFCGASNMHIDKLYASSVMLRLKHLENQNIVKL
jgi:hypothetical protein